MKKLILAMLIQSQAIYVGGSQGGTLAGNGSGTMGNGQGNMQLAGGAEANGGNSVGNMQLVGGAEANFGSGGGGVLVEYRAIKNSGHEV